MFELKTVAVFVDPDAPFNVDAQGFRPQAAYVARSPFMFWASFKANVWASAWLAERPWGEVLIWRHCEPPTFTAQRTGRRVQGRIE